MPPRLETDPVKAASAVLRELGGDRKAAEAKARQAWDYHYEEHGADAVVTRFWQHVLGNICERTEWPAVPDAPPAAGTRRFDANGKVIEVPAGPQLTKE